MKKICFLCLLLIVAVAFNLYRKQQIVCTSIPGCAYIAFKQHVEKSEKIGLYGKDRTLLREAKYDRVEGYDGYVVAHDYENGEVDIFTADGDSILPEIRKESCYFNDDDSIKYFIIEAMGLEYIHLLGTDKVVGPYPNLKILQDSLVISRDGGNLRIFNFSGEELTPEECKEVAFVEETTFIKKRKRLSSFTSHYLLANTQGLWLKMADRIVVDTVETGEVEELKNLEGTVSLEEHVFSVKRSFRPEG